MQNEICCYLVYENTVFFLLFTKHLFFISFTRLNVLPYLSHTPSIFVSSSFSLYPG